MTSYERRIYFERLCELRDAYRDAGPADRTTVMSVDGVVRHASRLLTALQAVAAASTVDLDPDVAAIVDRPVEAARRAVRRPARPS
jgi:hypothetical protein